MYCTGMVPVVAEAVRIIIDAVRFSCTSRILCCAPSVSSASRGSPATSWTRPTRPSPAPAAAAAEGARTTTPTAWRWGGGGEGGGEARWVGGEIVVDLLLFYQGLLLLHKCHAHLYILTTCSFRHLLDLKVWCTFLVHFLFVSYYTRLRGEGRKEISQCTFNLSLHLH